METGSKYHVSEEQMMLETDMIAAAKRNPEKFETLYKKYHEPIFRFIYQRLDDKEQAFDTTQQVFLNALTSLKKYEHRGVPFASWLYRIALSEVNQLFRKQKARRTINIDTMQVHEMMDEMKEDRLEQYYDKLPGIIATLPEDELQLVEMRFFEKRPFKEIAELLDLTENNAKVKLYRVLEKLKKMITGIKK